MREEYGDERRSKIIEREQAQAIDETTLIPNEPVTVVLSTGGFVRAAKGHDVDATSLSYKTGDELHSAVRGRSLQNAIFIDSTGRTYSLPAHSLPSARGQGEPLSGRLNPPDGARFAGVMLASRKTCGCSRATQATVSRCGSRSSPPIAARARPCSPFQRRRWCCRPRRSHRLTRSSPWPAAKASCWCSRSRTYPSCRAAKGNKLFDIPGKKAAAREEVVAGIAVVPPDGSLVVVSGERRMTLKWADLKEYRGQRAQRGAVLPRGWRNGQRLLADTGA